MYSFLALNLGIAPGVTALFLLDSQRKLAWRGQQIAEALFGVDLVDVEMIASDQVDQLEALDVLACV